jgi:hypothetical protein
MRLFVILLAMAAMLAGCSEASNVSERPEKEGAEQKSKEVSTPTPPPSTPAPQVESASADAEKAKAANHEMTLEDLEKMSDENAILLGTCQTAKYQMENGKAAMDRWTEDFVDDVASASSASEVVSVQEAMIKEGYSCTFQEMIQVSTSGTLEE